MHFTPNEYPLAFSILAEMAEIRAEQRCMLREAKRARRQLASGPDPSILDRLFGWTVKQ